MVSQSMALAMGQHGQRWRLLMLRGSMPLTSRRCLITKVCWLSSLVCCLKLWSAGLAVKACRTFQPCGVQALLFGLGITARSLCTTIWALLHQPGQAPTCTALMLRLTLSLLPSKRAFNSSEMLACD